MISSGNEELPQLAPVTIIVTISTQAEMQPGTMAVVLGGLILVAPDRNKKVIARKIMALGEKCIWFHQ